METTPGNNNRWRDRQDSDCTLIWLLLWIQIKELLIVVKGSKFDSLHLFKMASKSWARSPMSSERADTSDKQVDCSGTFLRTSVVASTFTLCALRDTGVYDGAPWLVESSSSRGLTADSDEVLPAVSHVLSGYLGNRRCSLTNQLNLASTLLRPSSTCLSAHRHTVSRSLGITDRKRLWIISISPFSLF